MLISLVILLLSSSLQALDTVYLDKHDPGKFSRRGYALEILKLALDKTVDSYGQYKLSTTAKMSRDRALLELESGGISVYDAPTRNEWENKTIPIFIPLTKGLLGYRLLLIRKSDRNKFSNIKDLDSLKKLKAGLGSQWSTTKVLKSMKGFNIIEGNSYLGLFTMLDSGRFDYFIRGVNEIYGELNNIKNTYPELIIEENLLLHIPMPMYFFVSKKYPNLAKRIEEGLITAISDGSFDKKFYEHHKENILKTNFSNRLLLNIGNPTLSIHKKYMTPKFWINLKELKKIK